MTQHRAAHPTRPTWLAWLLLVAVALMGLTITRQQALGSLHSHTDQGPRVSAALRAAASSLGKDWSRRWQQQQVFGHGQLLLGTAAYGALWHADSAAAADATRVNASDTHSHDTLERHHHAAHDASVVALDGAADSANTADSPAGAASPLLSGMGVPGAGFMVLAIASQAGPWPLGRFAALSTRSVPPLLRPPSV